MNNKSAVNQLLRELLSSPRVRRGAARQPTKNVKAAFAAVQTDDVASLARLVRTTQQANWRVPDRGWCLLDEAVKSGSLATVKWLLARGANPNTLFVNDRPCSAEEPYAAGLYFSPFATAIREEKIEIAELLLRAGATMDLPYWCHEDGSRQTCLDMAVESGMWPQLERSMIAHSLPAPTANARPQRL